MDANQKQHTELIEIKPAKEASMSAAKSLRDKYVVAVNMAKWAAADAFCRANGLKFRVVTEHDIFKNMKITCIFIKKIKPPQTSANPKLIFILWNYWKNNITT